MPKQPPIAKADLQKTQGARTPTAVKNNNDVISFINQPSMKEQLAAALPRHMTAERMIRIATTEIRKVPALGDCDTMSFVSAIVQCSQLGLEPGGALGHAYLLPFGNRNEKSGKK
ncbi:recombination protein RecT, partial [Salmonella enterica subsp. enterica]|nr:recombination protein RecT [Salmonella enterica subsp. enterica]